MENVVFSSKFRKSCLVVAAHCYGPKGTWAYHVYDFINANYFANRLPCPHIVWGLTLHGGCVAWASTVSDKSRPPIITLHPSLLGGSEKEDPWHIPPNFLGAALAFDTILHECIHIHITHNLGGQDGPTSHNCRRWIRQVNRIAPLLGFKGIHVGMSKTMRVPVEPPQYTARNKRVTRVVRRCVGSVPFRVGSGFPQAARMYLGQGSQFYTKDQLPAGVPLLG